MRRIIFVFLMIFSASSCSNKESSFKSFSKEDLMESLAWKIFIFTDEGDILPYVPIRNDFETIMNSKLTYADDIWKKKL